MSSALTIRKGKVWEQSPNYSNFRQVVRLGAFSKWQRNNSAEAKRIQERFERENGKQAA